MSEINRNPGDDGLPCLDYVLAMKAVADSILDPNKDAMFFLGAGASRSTLGESLPDAQMLAQGLASECYLDWNRYVALSTVAFYYESILGRAKLNSFIRDKITPRALQPSQTIQTLVELIVKLKAHGMRTLVVTTNYDQKFEEAYQSKTGKPPQTLIYHGALDPNDKEAVLYSGTGLGRYRKRPEYWQPDPLQPETYLFKMHGCVSEALDDDRSLVITEEDYVNFLANSFHTDPNKQILTHVRSRIATSTVLFIGYSLSDWNFRVIYKATAEGNRDHHAYAVQLHAPQGNKTELEIENLKWRRGVEFWEGKRVKIINVDAATFIKDVFDAVNSRLNEQSPLPQPAAAQ